MEILHCEQNSPEWHEARLGMPTASNFAAILASGRNGAPSKMRLTYMRKLAGERMTGLPAENYSNGYMERGHEMEAEARSLYEFATDHAVEQVGFIKNHGAGYSPDGLVGDRGLLEIKSMAPHILIEHWEANRVPPEHTAQIQGGMWVSERDWLDFRGYFPGMPSLDFHVPRDDSYITETLAPAVSTFIQELDELVARLKERK